MLGALPAAAAVGHLNSGHIVHEMADPGQDAAALPTHPIKFAVCGMSHDHIYGMVGAIQRGGGILIAAYGAEPDKVAAFQKRFPDVKMVASEDAILDDPSIQLVLSSTIPNERAALGVKVMKRGKDYLSDKPGLTTLEQLAEVRKTIAETKRIYGILYSEMLEVPAAVKAGQLVQAGAIGGSSRPSTSRRTRSSRRAATQAAALDAPTGSGNPKSSAASSATSARTRSTSSSISRGPPRPRSASRRSRTCRHPEHPRFQDFGDMVLRGNKGFGYVRLDWFTPDGLGTWGDGRLFVLGTKGYIEVRKYTNVGVSKQGNNLFIVDDKSSRYIDCSNVPLPFGPQFVADVVNRTHTAQDQEQALLAAELVVKAQMQAKLIKLTA